MYNTQEIVQRIKTELKSQGMTTSTMLAELGMGVNTLSEFAKGKQLSSVSLARIADYLNVSLDELTGRTTHITYGNVTGNNSGNAGNTNCSFGAAPDCSEEAKEIDHMLKSLSFKDRAQLMNIIVEFVESHKP